MLSPVRALTMLVPVPQKQGQNLELRMPIKGNISKTNKDIKNGQKFLNLLIEIYQIK